MMKPVIDFAKHVVNLANDIKQCKADIKELEFENTWGMFRSTREA